MPLDHYVPQVYLKNFYSPKLDSRMYAIRKSDLKEFTPNAKSVCRIEDGNTNVYLIHHREIEDFLLSVEPKYNKVLGKLSSERIDSECKEVIFGFISYILTCSPAGMRISTEPIRAAVENAIELLEENDKLPHRPPILVGEEIAPVIDDKYPQALGIDNIKSILNSLSRLPCDILINSDCSPFFTSDYPVAYEATEHHWIRNKIVPLSPNLAVRLYADKGLAGQAPEFRFKKVSQREVNAINRLIVQCAEDSVFFRDNMNWTYEFVKRNAGYRVMPRTSTFSNGKFIFTIEIVPS